MTEPAKSRSLNFTLEELLGLTPKENSESVRSESSGRPPTRHGRDSISQASALESTPLPTRRSNEEIEETNGNHSISHFNSPSPQRSPLDTTADEEFLDKLNTIRRRSLVSTKLPEDHRIPVARSQMIEERNESSLDREANDINSKDASQKKIISTRPSTSDSINTFKVEESDKGISTKRDSNGGISKKNGASTKLPVSSLTRPPTPGSAHERWLRQKKEAERDRRIRQKEIEERKKAEDAEKKSEAKKTFAKWKSEFEQKLKEKREREKRVERKAKEEKEERLKDAQKTYQAWIKEKKDGEREMAEKEEKKKERRRSLEKQRLQDRAQKKQEAQAAFEAWSRAKAAYEESEAQRKKTEMDVENSIKKAEQEYKKALAEEAYTTWLKLKEEESAFEKSSLVERMLIRSASAIPWIPPSNTVPRTFTASGRGRRRSLDAPRRLSMMNRAPFSWRHTHSNNNNPAQRPQSAKISIVK